MHRKGVRGARVKEVRFQRWELFSNKCVNVCVNFTNLIGTVYTRRRHAITVGFLDTNEVITFIDREDKEGIILIDSISSEAREEGSECIIVRFQLLHISG